MIFELRRKFEAKILLHLELNMDLQYCFALAKGNTINSGG